MKVLFSILGCVVFLSCSTNAHFDLESGGKGSFSFQTEASDGVSSILRSFTGTGFAASIFDTAAIEKSFSSVGIEPVSVVSVGTTDISVSGFFHDINKLLPGQEQLFEIANTSSGTELSLLLDEETMGELFSLMGEDALLYVELLQAPIFTGEEMSPDEYLGFIGALYGNDQLVQDLEEATVSVEIQTPSVVKSAQIYPVSLAEIKIVENRAIYTLFLNKILSNTDDIIFRIQW